MMLIDTGKMKLTLSGTPTPFADFDSNGLPVYRQTAADNSNVETDLLIEGSGEVTWPNREGERFFLSDVYQRLAEFDGTTRGVNLCWPTTASVQAVGLIDEAIIHSFHSDPDTDGRVRFLEIRSDEPGSVCFRFTGIPTDWRLTSRCLPESKISPDERPTELSMYQIGLIGPEGECEIPDNRGFKVLGDAGRALISQFGTPLPGDIVHVFGYAEGHDRGYPDYTPSVKLGGATALKAAIKDLKNLGYDVSLYLNARLTERSRLGDYPQLKRSVLTDNDGRLIIEEYHGRKFAVMNPLSKDWIDHLLSEVEVLRSLGASWVQLDQVAGRSAPVAPGAGWGKGYRDLIVDIQKLGMKVWIQGVSDYYPADAFEATWRPVNVLKDGTLRHGWPMGTPDTTLIETTGFDSPLIVPQNKSESLKNSGLSILHDPISVGDRLPLWGKEWLNTLISNNYPRFSGGFNGGIQ
jgi:hypothetical protein